MNKEKEEMDFLVTESGNSLFMVEAKFSDAERQSLCGEFYLAEREEY